MAGLDQTSASGKHRPMILAAKVSLYAAPLAAALASTVLSSAGLLPLWFDPDGLVWIALISSTIGMGLALAGERRINCRWRDQSLSANDAQDVT